MNRVFVILGVLLIVFSVGCNTAGEMVDDVISMPIAEDVASTSLTFRVTPMSVRSPAVGQQFTVNVDIALGENVAGYQVSLAFDATALRYVSRSNGDYLPPGAFVVPTGNVVDRVLLSAQALAGTSDGDGTLATVTFEVVAVKRSSLQLSGAITTDFNGETTSAAVEHAEVVP
ncbi:hypothetical protein F4Y93_06585 [Candidatus Poribacteria bacterium]|nr:hypothetical protein [Candidatus Poribacteria bacterium]